MPDTTRRPDMHASGKTDWAALDAMTDAEAEANARADPDALPSDRPTHRMAPIKRLRLALRLSVDDFAARYNIPPATLSAWERHTATPDSIAQAYIALITADPEGVAATVARAAPADAAE